MTADAIIRYRHERKGRTWSETPARVVQDDGDVTVLWWPAGTVYRTPRLTERSEHLGFLVTGQWELEDKVWWGGFSLQVIPTGAAFAIWPFRFEAGGDVVGWYVNLQAPLRRSGDALTTTDHTLDLWLSTDLAERTWKDEDELAEAVGLGIYTDEDAAAFRVDGESVIRMADAGDALFSAWIDWQPDPTWQVPVLA